MSNNNDKGAALTIIELCSEIQELAEEHEKQTRKALNPNEMTQPWTLKKPTQKDTSTPTNTQ